MVRGMALTKDKGKNIRNGQAEQVVVGGCMHVCIFHNDNASESITHCSCQEDERVNQRQNDGFFATAVTSPKWALQQRIDIRDWSIITQ